MTVNSFQFYFVVFIVTLAKQYKSFTCKMVTVSQQQKTTLLQQSGFLSFMLL
ncbi:hypothetical protein JCM19301_2336 [Jejuia pallidilutea]|uniref:Uncharacterized protein n=1 Tax=Jejuia pallidilutea TaxID=504487 RepID=A0A090W129_9FLAO|nr:hypothetical protein JCM19301_2336 [Jejuia pallidilutea]GAL90773.1 hypothetical protein JCM19538_2174 [Jejuia pallidilutea]